MTVTTATAVWAAQLVATVGMVIPAFVEIEWIMGAGPILSIAGLVMATFARRLQSTVVLLYGLSGPLVCALCAALIAINSWGPEESRAPIGVIIVVYAILAVPLAIVAFLQIRWPYAEPSAKPPRAWQFSLRSLLVLMTAVCVVIAVGRLLFRNVSRDESYFFGGYALACIVLSAGVAWRFYGANIRGRPL